MGFQKTRGFSKRLTIITCTLGLCIFYTHEYISTLNLIHQQACNTTESQAKVTADSKSQSKVTADLKSQPRVTSSKLQAKVTADSSLQTSPAADSSLTWPEDNSLNGTLFMCHIPWGSQGTGNTLWQIASALGIAHTMAMAPIFEDWFLHNKGLVTLFPRISTLTFRSTVDYWHVPEGYTRIQEENTGKYHPRFSFPNDQEKDIVIQYSYLQSYRYISEIEGQIKTLFTVNGSLKAKAQDILHGAQPARVKREGKMLLRVSLYYLSRGSLYRQSAKTVFGNSNLTTKIYTFFSADVRWVAFDGDPALLVHDDM